MTQAVPSRLSYDGISGFEAHVGEHLGYSDWHDVTQKQIDLFADATGDHQWIHVDAEKAATGPYGRTIAHGYLTLVAGSHSGAADLQGDRSVDASELRRRQASLSRRGSRRLAHPGGSRADQGGTQRQGRAAPPCA